MEISGLPSFSGIKARKASSDPDNHPMLSALPFAFMSKETPGFSLAKENPSPETSTTKGSTASAGTPPSL